MADAITLFRMAASLALLFFPAYSPAFFALYIAAGFSDVFDGIAARKTHTASESGAKLDTAADTVFAAVCLIKLLPGLHIPLWLYVWIGIIALIKLINVISGFIVRKRFTALHTAANKAAGVLLFLLPLTFSRLDPTVSVPPGLRRRDVCRDSGRTPDPDGSACRERRRRPRIKPVLQNCHPFVTRFDVARAALPV